MVPRGLGGAQDDVQDGAQIADDGWLQTASNTSPDAKRPLQDGPKWPRSFPGRPPGGQNP
eukprot:7018221-Pyramimonas_sp.AAC.1